ncbi:MAG TPA: AraC family transcriptional regulator [Methylotenera sp.]|jgi:AraC-like DNA-binding protein|nr:AraC family transcriptional regulator [Methylotenera sp.]
MTDRLEALFNQHALNARMIFSGTLCNTTLFSEDANRGFLHLVRKGKLIVYSPTHAPISIEQPSLLLYPSAVKHQFVFDGDVDLTCASIDLDGGSGVLANALPAVLLMPFDGLPTLSSTLSLLMAEAEQHHCGRQAAIDRLFEYLLIQLLRHILDHQQINIGLLAGLADKRLAKAITAMHNAPSRAWSLESLAQEAGMSRARFAVRFREIVGTTPIENLTQWRIGLAKNLLKQGKPIGLVANEMGYSNAAVFTRAFKAAVGQTPKTWTGIQT